MGDLRSKQDVSVGDELSGDHLQIDSDRDAHVKSKLWDGTNQVTVTGNKLDVNATVSAGENTDLWKTKYTHSKTEATISSTDVSIFNITNEGRIDFVSINFDSDNLEVSVHIDGVEELRISMEDLHDKKLYHLEGAKDEVGYVASSPFFSVRGDKQLMLKDNIYFATSFEIKAKVLPNEDDAKMLAYFVKWRDKA